MKLRIGDRHHLPDGRWGTIVTTRGAARGGKVWCGVSLDEGGIVCLSIEIGETEDRLLVTDVPVAQAFELAQLVIGGASVAMPVQSQLLLLAHALIATARPS